MNVQMNATLPQKRKKNIWGKIWANWQLYLILLPVIAWYIVFAYAPMSGLVLAFKDYSFRGGVWGSPWVGTENFERILRDKDFIISLRNTAILSLGGLALQMPAAIMLALGISELRMGRTKKVIQTIVTFPHFISWVVLSGIVLGMFNSTGLVSQVCRAVGAGAPNVFTNPNSYRWFIWLSDIWKEVGWDCIIYMAAITGIDPGLYEAAMVDGANRVRRIWHITMPGIRSTFCIVLILNIGSILTNGRFDQIYNTYNPLLYATGDTIDTYVFRQTFLGGGMDYGYSTAIGVIKSVVGLVMILAANKSIKLLGEEALL